MKTKTADETGERRTSSIYFLTTEQGEKAEKKQTQPISILERRKSHDDIEKISE
jgi:prolyl oligopeptidase PreP (S9A serine peptidase family)